MRPRYDIAVIGGGIVGAATAYTLSSNPRLRIVLVEKEERLAAHQTGHNSGVIHSGLYYRPDSAKAKNCVEGRRELLQFCDAHRIPYELCGKLVIATRPEEIPALEELERRGAANGLKGLRRVPPEEIDAYEPHAAGLAALHVPETGIVDFAAVTWKMGEVFKDHGGEIATGACVKKVRRFPEELAIETSHGDIRAGFLINCAGLHSDRVAALCGMKPDVRIIPFRGEYYNLVPEKRDLVRNLIYPVPDPRFPFLGAHFTRMIEGGIEAGPNAVLALKREGYRRVDVSLRDCGGIVLFGGFWRMARQYWKTGLGEMYRSWSKRAFVKALSRLVPEINPDDVTPGGSGVRAQAVDRHGNILDDFHILHAERMVHVLNAPSPAATAALSIARTIASLMES